MKKRFVFALLLCCAAASCLCQQKGRLVPDFAVVQYAGSIGYFSGGIGYDIIGSYARLSAHAGVVPEGRGGTLGTVAAKLMFKPATITVWNRVRFNPFDIGVMASFHYGNNPGTAPEALRPKGYYWWHPALRTHIVMENAVTYEFRKGHRFRSLAGYVEIDTNELYFASFIRNMGAVKLADIVRLGTGFRLNF